MSAVTTTFPTDTIEASTVNDLTMRSKILIGGVGALTPIILNLLVVDLQTTFARISAMVVVGYLIRVGVLFCIGGGIAYLHKNEKSALKLFEIGIVAPATITALMNGSNIKPIEDRASTEPAAVTASVMDLIMPTAYAQGEEQEIKAYTRPEESVAAQLWKGISGSHTERVWHVVAGTYKTDELQKARELARRITKTSPPYKTSIYKNEKYYAVVIGANLTLAQAKARKESAANAKMPTDGDIYLYNPWDSK